MMKKEQPLFIRILIVLLIVIAAVRVNFACLRIGTAIIGIDYADYYAAGRMVIDGNIGQIYNMEAHHAVLESLFGKIPYLLEWIYPPTFLLSIVPLSYLPFDASLVVWLVLSFIPAALAVYFMTGKNKFAPICFLAFPGTFLNIRWGQNGFLTAALFGFGVYFVESNPMLAGLMFGLLTFKPQMAIFPFIILFFTKKWKALGWSVGFAAALAVLTGLLFGFQTWIDFFSTSLYNAQQLGASWEATSWGIPTLSTALRTMGMSGWGLTLILLAVAAFAIYCCVRVWKQTQSYSLRLMALVLCLFLSFPYVSLYDFAILGVPFTLLFFEAQKNPKRSFSPLLLCLLWGLPLVCLIIFFQFKLQLCPFVLMGYMIAIVQKANRDAEVLSIQQAE
jgi:hypothetical protein